MTSKQVKERTFNVWQAIEEGVANDILIQQKIHKFSISEKAVKAIAYNAAFLGCVKVLSLLTGGKE
jgi:hypothetical protein